MMKQFDSLCYILAGILLAACSKQPEEASGGREVVLSVYMPSQGAATRAHMEKKPEGSGYYVAWDAASEETIHMVAIQKGRGYDCGDATVEEVSEDGRTATIRFFLHNAIVEQNTYTVFGFDKVMPVISPSVTSDDNIPLTWRAELSRQAVGSAEGNLSAFGLPLYFTYVSGAEAEQVECRHIGTYELLHVKNTTDKAVTFRHLGFDNFDVCAWWHTDITCYEGRNYNFVEMEAGDADSDAVTIPAGGTGTIVSRDIPNGRKIQEATLLANIDGQRVVSFNSLSSNLTLQIGHAYNMYITWDGVNLYFPSDGSGYLEGGGSGYENPGLGNLDGGGSGFAFEDAGPVAGGGVGYGADESGQLSGNGGTYGGDSGTLAGGGSGYSGGN